MRSEMYALQIYRPIKLCCKAYRKNYIVFKTNISVYLKKQMFDQCVLLVLTYVNVDPNWSSET